MNAREALEPMKIEEASLLTYADVAYIRSNYWTVEELCEDRPEDTEDIRRLIEDGRLPRASYLLPDGTEMFPSDYFAMPDAAEGPDGLSDEFGRRYTAAVQATLDAHPDGELPDGWSAGLETTWQGYMAGIYGVCLRDVTPEAMVRKDEAMALIDEMLEHPRGTDPRWLAALRRYVVALDRLEREFSPDYDRVAFEAAPSRDRLIARAKELYPQAFSAAHVRKCEYRPSQQASDARISHVATNAER